MKTVLIVGAFSAPQLNAGGQRVVNLAKALRAMGWQAIVAGASAPPRSAFEDQREEQGIHVLGVETARRSSRAAAIIRLLRSGAALASALAEHSLMPPDLILCYHGSVEYLVHVRRLAEEYDVPVVADATEWHEWGSHFPAALAPALLDQAIRMHILVPSWEWSVLTISRELTEFYRGRGARVLEVPPLVDSAEWCPRDGSRIAAAGELRLVYFGDASRDDWRLQCEGVRWAKERGCTIALTIIGSERKKEITTAWLKAGLREQDLSVRTRVPRHALMEAVQEADALVMLRPNERWARACFPSRVPEALALGTTIVTNDTAAIVAYQLRLGDVLHSIRPSVAEFGAVLTSLAGLSAQEREARRERARNAAIELFDVRAWGGHLDRFLTGTARKGRGSDGGEDRKS